MLPTLILGTLAIACASGSFRHNYHPGGVRVEYVPGGGEHGTLRGVVHLIDRYGRFDEALVILQCSCIEGTRETRTTPAGIYRFTNLPPGSYTVQVLAATSERTQVATVEAGDTVYIDFTLNLSQDQMRTVT